MGWSIINHEFWGAPIYGSPHIAHLHISGYVYPSKIISAPRWNSDANDWCGYAPRTSVSNEDPSYAPTNSGFSAAYTGGMWTRSVGLKVGEASVNPMDGTDEITRKSKAFELEF